MKKTKTELRIMWIKSMLLIFVPLMLILYIPYLLFIIIYLLVTKKLNINKYMNTFWLVDYWEENWFHTGDINLKPKDITPTSTINKITEVLQKEKLEKMNNYEEDRYNTPTEQEEVIVEDYPNIFEQSTTNEVFQEEDKSNSDSFNDFIIINEEESTRNEITDNSLKKEEVTEISKDELTEKPKAVTKKSNFFEKKKSKLFDNSESSKLKSSGSNNFLK